jgi:hypothetical protein
MTGQCLQGVLNMVSKIYRVAIFFVVLSIGAAGCHMASAASTVLPMPATDESAAPGAGLRTAVVAGGCFWGIQDVFQHVRGVVSATSGYAGGTAALTANCCGYSWRSVTIRPSLTGRGPTPEFNIDR